MFSKIICLCLGICFLTMIHSGQLLADTAHLTFSSFFPATHSQSQLAEAWAQEVEEQTEGQVEITFFPGQSLAAADQTFDAVLTGRADIGMSCFLYTRGRFPLLDFINLPFGNPSGEFATAILNEVYHKFEPEELNDVQVMYLHAHGPGLIHTKDKPVQTLEDLQGLRLRCPGSVAETVELWGATPVTMPMPEVYQALQRNVVQGAVYPLETNEGWKMGEVVDYVTAEYSSAYSVGFFVVMNKDKWRNLPDDVQQTIAELNKIWAVKHGQEWDYSDYRGLQSLLSAGKQIQGLDPEEASRWEKRVEPVFENYIQSTEEKDLPGEEVLEYLDKKLKKYEEGDFESDYLP